MTYGLEFGHATTFGGAMEIDAAVVAAANTPRSPLQRVPQFVPRDEVYYWSYAWQESQSRSEEQLAAGESVDFDNARDLVRWLLSDD